MANDAETVRLRAETCQRIVANCIAGRSSLDTLIDDLRTQAGVTPEEANTYIEQVQQHFAAQRAERIRDHGEDESEQRVATPPGLLEEAAAELREHRKAEEEVTRHRAEET